MKRTTLLIIGAMVCGCWVTAVLAEDDRPSKKLDRAAATQPAGYDDEGRTDPRRKQFKGGRPYAGEDHRRRGPGRRFGGDGPRDPHQVEEFMKFAEKEFPMLYERMKHAREKHPGGFEPIRRRINELMKLRRENPELAEKVIAQHRHEMKVGDLHRQYRHARTQEERDAIAAEIRSELEVGFQLRIERLQLEIAQLEQRLAEAKETLADQEQNKSAVIEEHFQKLISSNPPIPPKRP
jgi:hypothetical protein